MKRMLYLIGLSGWVSMAVAGVQLQLTTDHTTVAQDEDIQLQVTVQGTSSAPEPQIAGTQDFEVQSAGTSTSVQIINGATTSSTTFTYVLTPKRTGTFHVGPARAVVDNTAYTSNTLDLTVVKSGAPGSGSQASRSPRPFRVEARVDNSTPYVNQQVIYTFRFLNRGRMQGANLGWPDFNGFMKEDLGSQREYETMIEGNRWTVTELKLALFPTTPGELTISPATLVGNAVVEGKRRRGMFDDFFQDDGFFGMGLQTKRVTLKTDPITMKVEALPAAGKPAHFSGLVGDFRLSGGLSKDTVAVGDSTTLSIVLEGRGNVRDAKAPDLDLKGFKVYDDQPVFKGDVVGDRIGGTKTFKKALVPLESGRLVVPEVAFDYFDPTARAYKVARLPAQALTVNPGAGGAEVTSHTGGTAGSVTDTKQEIQVRGSDIMPVKRGPLLLSSGELTPLDRWLALVSLFGSPAAFLGLVLFKKRSDRLQGNRSLIRSARAYRAFLQSLKRQNGGFGLDEASALLAKYLGEKLDFDGKSLTAADVERKLKPHRVSETTIREAERLLSLFESARYGGGTASLPPDLREKVKSVVEKLEEEIPA